MNIVSREPADFQMFKVEDANVVRLLYRDEVMWFIIEMGNMEQLNLFLSNKLERQYQQRWLEKKDPIGQ